jgi:hypothetical protein
LEPSNLITAGEEQTMPAREPSGPIDFAGPARYRIVVQGVVGEHWRDRLAGLSVSTFERPGTPPRTTLLGQIRDQAELNGVLDTLYGLHLPILSVETLEEQS